MRLTHANVEELRTRMVAVLGEWATVRGDLDLWQGDGIGRLARADARARSEVGLGRLFDALDAACEMVNPGSMAAAHDDE